jgi:hypothetical protein
LLTRSSRCATKTASTANRPQPPSSTSIAAPHAVIAASLLEAVALSAGVTHTPGGLEIAAEIAA